MIRRPPRSTHCMAASDVYKRQEKDRAAEAAQASDGEQAVEKAAGADEPLSLIHISEPTRLALI
eukprot:6588445-Alexandrium_andersonii.AAC.1